MTILIKSIMSITVAMFMMTGCANKQKGSKRHDLESLKQTGTDIREAFARGDVLTILEYHHPNVMKALDYNKIIDGCDDLKEDLQGTFAAYNLEFVDYQPESYLIKGKTAVTQGTFVIRGIPRGNGQPFIFKGRALVVYVRYKESPTGWASIREVIQPYTE